MTQKERLVELLKSVSPIIGELCNAAGTHVVPIVSNSYIADYLLENGVIVPPCKVGDVVYRLDIDCKMPIIHNCDDNCFSCKHMVSSVCELPVRSCFDQVTVMNRYGKFYFLTREEAEQALMERETKC